MFTYVFSVVHFTISWYKENFFIGINIDKKNLSNIVKFYKYEKLSDLAKNILFLFKEYMYLWYS